MKIAVFEVFLPPKKQQDEGETPSFEMNAVEFLAQIIAEDDPHTDKALVHNLAQVVNEDAVLSDGQQIVVRSVVVRGSLKGDYYFALMSVATFINTCH